MRVTLWKFCGDVWFEKTKKIGSTIGSEKIDILTQSTSVADVSDISDFVFSTSIVNKKMK